MVLRPPAMETCSAASGSALSARTASVSASAVASLSAWLRMSASGAPAASWITSMHPASKRIGGRP